MLSVPKVLLILKFNFYYRCNLKFDFYNLNTLIPIKSYEIPVAQNISLFNDNTQLVACDLAGIFVSNLLDPKNKKLLQVDDKDNALISNPIILKDNYLFYLYHDKKELYLNKFNLITGEKNVLIKRKFEVHYFRNLIKISEDLILLQNGGNMELISFDGHSLKLPYLFHSIIQLSRTKMVLRNDPPSIVELKYDFFQPKEVRDLISNPFPIATEKTKLWDYLRDKYEEEEEEDEEEEIKVEGKDNDDEEEDEEEDIYDKDYEHDELFRSQVCRINDDYFAFVSDRANVFLVKSSGEKKELIPPIRKKLTIGRGCQAVYYEEFDILIATGVYLNEVVIIKGLIKEVPEFKFFPVPDDTQFGIKDLYLVPLSSKEYIKQVKSVLSLVNIPTDLQCVTAEFLSVSSSEFRIKD